MLTYGPLQGYEAEARCGVKVRGMAPTVIMLGIKGS